MKQATTTLLTCLIWLSIPFFSFANSSAPETERSKEIWLQHRLKVKSVSFQENKKITVWTKDGKKFKGKFAIENDSAIRVENQTIQVSDITHLRVPRRSTQIIGAILSIPGAFLTGLGLALLGNYSSNQTNLEGLFSLLFGIMLLLVGGIPLIIGVPLMFLGRKFNFLTKWDMSIKEVNPVQKT
ncbi:MAG: hypothetical protein AAF587_06910 [Bacteroidota bacterium]